jgi:hypothetical protein
MSSLRLVGVRVCFEGGSVAASEAPPFAISDLGRRAFLGGNDSAPGVGARKARARVSGRHARATRHARGGRLARGRLAVVACASACACGRASRHFQTRLVDFGRPDRERQPKSRDLNPSSSDPATRARTGWIMTMTRRLGEKRRNRLWNAPRRAGSSTAPRAYRSAREGRFSRKVAVAARGRAHAGCGSRGARPSRVLPVERGRFDLRPEVVVGSYLPRGIAISALRAIGRTEGSLTARASRALPVVVARDGHLRARGGRRRPLGCGDDVQARGVHPRRAIMPARALDHGDDARPAGAGVPRVRRAGGPRARARQAERLQPVHPVPQREQQGPRRRRAARVARRGLKERIRRLRARPAVASRALSVRGRGRRRARKEGQNARGPEPASADAHTANPLR